MGVEPPGPVDPGAESESSGAPEVVRIAVYFVCVVLAMAAIILVTVLRA
jgi:hypothetical protein